MRSISSIALLSIVSVIGPAAHAQGGSFMTYQTDTALHGFAECIARTNDSGFAIASSMRDASSIARLSVLKTDVQGALQWSRAFGPVSKLDLPEVIALPSGGLLVMGATYPVRDLLLIRTDDQGDTLWTTVLDHPVLCVAKSAVELANGDLIVASHTHQALYLTRLSSAGSMLWSHGYRGSPVTMATLSEPRLDMILGADSTLVIACALPNSNATDSEDLILKTDLSGNVIQGSFFGGTDEDGVRSIVQMDDGGYLVAGYHWVTYREPFLMRLDSTGDVVWSRYYPSLYTPVLRFILLDDDGNPIIGGRYQDGTSTHGLLFKTDDQGEVIWSYEHGAQHGFTDGIRAGSGAALIGSSEVGMHPQVALMLQDTLGAVSCTLTPYPLTPVDVVLNKVDVVNVIAGVSVMALAVTVTTPPLLEVTECQSTGLVQHIPTPMLIITPNPASGTCALRIEGSATLQRLEMMDASGRTLLVQERPSRTLELGAVTPGVYLLKVVIDGVPQLQRLLVQ